MLALWLLLFCAGGFAGQLDDEPSESMKAWFQKRQPELVNIRVAAKARVDQNYWAIVALASPPGWEHDNRFVGVFVVYGRTNHVYMVLEIRQASDYEEDYLLDFPTRTSVHVHATGYYGVYTGSYRYNYDLLARRTSGAVPYTRFSFEDGVPRGDTLTVTGKARRSDDPNGKQTAPIGVLLRPGRDPEITEPPGEPQFDAPEWVRRSLPYEFGIAKDFPPVVRHSDTRWIVILQEQSPRNADLKPGIYVLDKGSKPRYAAVPVPTLEEYRKYRLQNQVNYPPDDPTLENEVGPAASDGQSFWFANDFYEGEGWSGVGAIGRLDPDTLRLEMHYLREITPWAASALMTHGGMIYAGLLHRPEGTPVSGGLLTWNRRANQVRIRSVPDVIRGIYRLGEEMWLTTEHGLYRQRGGRWTIFRPEPDSAGKLAWRVVTPDFP